MSQIRGAWFSLTCQPYHLVRARPLWPHVGEPLMWRKTWISPIESWLCVWRGRLGGIILVSNHASHYPSRWCGHCLFVRNEAGSCTKCSISTGWPSHTSSNITAISTSQIMRVFPMQLQDILVSCELEQLCLGPWVAPNHCSRANCQCTYVPFRERDINSHESVRRKQTRAVRQTTGALVWGNIEKDSLQGDYVGGRRRSRLHQLIFTIAVLTMSLPYSYLLRPNLGDVINLNAQIPHAIRITIAVEVKTIGAVEVPVAEIIWSDVFRGRAQVVTLHFFELNLLWRGWFLNPSWKGTRLVVSTTDQNRLFRCY